MQAVGSSLNRILETIERICNAHQMRPDFGYGPSADINATNDVYYPLVWVEPTQDSKVVNSIQGVRVKQYGLNIYAIDRINKGDDNFQELHSDMMYLLDTIIAYIRESSFTRDQFIAIDYQDQIYTPVTRETDENCNGFKCKLLLRTPDVYTPCNSPFDIINPQYIGLFNVVDAGSDDVIADSLIAINVIDAGMDDVVAVSTPVPGNIINVIDAAIDDVLN